MSLKKELRKFNPRLSKTKRKGPTGKVAGKVGSKAGTFDLQGNRRVLGSGFQVSTRRPELSTDEADLLARKHLKKAKYNVGVYEGSAEPSLTIDSSKDAMAIAKKFNQVSIWANRGGHEIKNPDYNLDTTLAVTKRGVLIRTTIINNAKKKK